MGWVCGLGGVEGDGHNRGHTLHGSSVQVFPQPRASGHTHSLLAAPTSLAWYTYVWCVVFMNTWL